MTRRAFIESHGATCRNWTWSWSFVNHLERFVVFGAWDRFTERGKAMIFAEGWERYANGRKKPGYGQSLEHIRLIETEGYALRTFPMRWAMAEDGGDEGLARIDGFVPELSPKRLSREGDAWFAVNP